MRSGTAHRDRLAALIEPVIAAAGYDLEAVSVSQAGRRSLVRVVLDGEHGVSLDEVAEVSRAVSELLDAHDGVLGAMPYVLEVTSPGVDRPLTEPRHWRRAAGRLVRVPVAGEGTVLGRVLRADDTAVVLEVAGERRELGYARLGKGAVQVELNRTGEDTAGPELAESNLAEEEL
ncbi:MAG TPA: ribosome maturation factor RimP [Mycobacteriales bacterium]|nr:ribosome maturation factor RimP [Mycobacteriales bacterium]